jgi:hypothetical protein
MKSGDKLQTLAGTTVSLPYAGEKACVMQNNGSCNQPATWRLVGEHWILHFCEHCKGKVKLPGKWEQMEARPGKGLAE